MPTPWGSPLAVMIACSFAMLAWLGHRGRPFSPQALLPELFRCRGGSASALLLFRFVRDRGRENPHVAKGIAQSAVARAVKAIRDREDHGGSGIDRAPRHLIDIVNFDMNHDGRSARSEER